MSDYDNTNTGALFKNDKRESEKQPLYKGQLNVEGAEFWISAWLKESKNGDKYMSLSVQPKEQKASKPAPKRPSVDDDVPL